MNWLRDFLKVTGLAFTALLLFWVTASAAPTFAVASIAELQAAAPAPVILVASYHPGLNKGGGIFVWAPGPGAADNCTSFAGNGGRWLRQLSGPLNVTMCGAWWDNSHDDAAILTHASRWPRVRASASGCRAALARSARR